MEQEVRTRHAHSDDSSYQFESSLISPSAFVFCVVRSLASDHGHDGFLTEIRQVGEIVRESLSGSSTDKEPGPE